MLRVVGAAKRYRGPMKAADEVDPDKGTAFSACATRWIGQSMGRKPTNKEDG